ncbi:MAG TPA: hypothetical protein VIL18_04410 [Longimicrobiales bacterium]
MPTPARLAPGAAAFFAMALAVPGSLATGIAATQAAARRGSQWRNVGYRPSRV